jgi:hypothetical protein
MLCIGRLERFQSPGSGLSRLPRRRKIRPLGERCVSCVSANPYRAQKLYMFCMSILCDRRSAYCAKIWKCVTIASYGVKD